LPVQVNSDAAANFACGDMAPARPAANTSEQWKGGVSIRCNGRRKTVVKTGRKARPGANPFNLPYRVRLLSTCTPLPCAAGECIRRKVACKVYHAGSRAKTGYASVPCTSQMAARAYRKSMCRQGDGWACTHILKSCPRGFAAYSDARVCRYVPLSAGRCRSRSNARDSKTPVQRRI